MERDGGGLGRVKRTRQIWDTLWRQTEKSSQWTGMQREKGKLFLLLFCWSRWMHSI